MALSEIEKLERRYAENPQGLTFAPLAEVHRKNGEVQRALDLLKPGLELHPDYIPASIVLGRCHFDLGDLPAAEAAFSHVLVLDGENVIAIKALADISERLLKFDDAERWLNTLLSIDHSNEEAREQLKRVEVSRRQAEVASAVEPAAVEPATVEPSAMDAAIQEEPIGLMPAEAAVTVTPPPYQPEPAALALDQLEPSPLSDEVGQPPAGLQLEEAATLDQSVEPIADLVGREVDTPDAAGEFREFRVETSEEIILRSAGGGEFQVPDASLELYSRTAGESAPPVEPAPEAPTGQAPEPVETPEAESAPAVWSFDPILVEAAGMVPPAQPEPEEAAPPPEPVVETAPESRSEPAAWTEPEAEVLPAGEPAVEAVAQDLSQPAAPQPATPPPALAPPEPEPEPVVTETMAEVLLQQGHSVEALVVYRELVSRSGDPRLRQRVAELEAAQPPASAVRYTAAATGGRSVAELMRGILAARPPAQAAPPAVRPGAPAEGAPTRPAAEALSLSSVFGEETPAAPPAVPAPAPEPERVSFDDFYGGASQGQSARGPRAADSKNDDLDEFHAWLQNLKR